MIFEGSPPNCIHQGRHWYHPDMILGECIESIGNETLHKPVQRSAVGGRHGSHHLEAFEARWQSNKSHPLWNGGDIRRRTGGIRYPLVGECNWTEITNRNGQPWGSNAFHFHNFFVNSSNIRHKYYTFGHPHADAWVENLGKLNTALGLMVRCVMNLTDNSSTISWVDGELQNIEGSVPLFFADKEVRSIQDRQLREVIAFDEAMYGNMSG